MTISKREVRLEMLLTTFQNVFFQLWLEKKAIVKSPFLGVIQAPYIFLPSPVIKSAVIVISES